LADATLMNFYKQRHYHVSEFSNVMAMFPGGESRSDLPPGLEIRVAQPGEFDLWTLTVAQGFAETQAVTPELLSIMRMFATVPGTECFLASIDGQTVAGATLAVRGSIAGLFGASTLPEFRKRGVQTALLRARLRRASELGCRLAMSIALPGSISQRNMTRVGFQTLYTRVKFERPCPHGAAAGN